MIDIFSIKFKIKVWAEIIFGYFLSLFFTEKDFKEYKFPLEIGGYKFMEEFKSQDQMETSFKIGLYEDLNGKKAIAKIYYKDIKNIEYYWLINEIKVYLGLNYLYTNNKREIRDKFPDINTPNMIFFEIKKGSTIILTEFLEGKNIENISPEKEAIILDRVLDYFYFLGKFSDDYKLKKFFIKRGGLFFVFAVNIYALKTIIRFPSLALEILKVYKFFILNCWFLFKAEGFGIVHRDLNLRNVLFDEKNSMINIIDFGLTIYSIRIFDAVVTNKRAFIAGKLMRELGNKKVMQMIMNSKAHFSNFKALSSYLAICVLAICPMEYKKDSYNYLNYILNLKYEN